MLCPHPELQEIRRRHLEVVAYLNAGLPPDLSSEEIEALRATLPPQLQGRRKRHENGFHVLRRVSAQTSYHCILGAVSLLYCIYWSLVRFSRCLRTQQRLRTLPGLIYYTCSEAAKTRLGEILLDRFFRIVVSIVSGFVDGVKQVWRDHVVVEDVWRRAMMFSSALLGR